MIKVSKNICFKIIGFHHTLSIIAICKTIGVSLSEVGTKFKEERNYEGIRLHILLVFSIFST